MTASSRPSTHSPNRTEPPLSEVRRPHEARPPDHHLGPAHHPDLTRLRRPARAVRGMGAERRGGRVTISERRIWRGVGILWFGLQVAILAAHYAGWWVR